MPAHDRPMPTHDRPKKLQRISQACDLCHRRSIRCRPSVENPQQQCQNCYDFAVECTYKRPSRRRRNASVSQTSPPNILPSQQVHIKSPRSPQERINSSFNGYTALAATKGSPDFTGAYASVREGGSDDGTAVAWRSFAVASTDTIDKLMDVFMDVVYPIMPIFHVPTLFERLRRRDYLTDRAFFSSVLAACALASARARDGALNDGHASPKDEPQSQSEIFFAAAQDTIYKDLTRCSGINYLRACALLAMTGLQYGQIATMQQYLGQYATLCAMQQFHDESHWPANLGVVEKEERRRLYWAMYSVDVYASVVFNSVLHFQETHANVRYPTELNDEDLTNAASSPRPEVNWLRGWNFTIDLYRVMEHAIKRVRRSRHQPDDRPAVANLLVADGLPDVTIMEQVLSLYYQLPNRFKDFNVPMTGNRSQDIFGFQAANIQATLQLLRMTLFSVNGTQDIQQKCNVANEVLTTFHSIAPQFLRALSTPLVYHLGGIGHTLASVMDGLLNEESYQRVRALLVSMAELLVELESSLQPTTGASKGLRAQIDAIDQYMQAQRRLISMPPQTQAAPNANPAAVAAMPNPRDSFTDVYHPSGFGMTLPHDMGEWPWPFEFQGEQHGHHHNVPAIHAFAETA